MKLMSTIFKGVFRNEKLISGVKVRTSKAIVTKGNMLHVEFSTFRNDSEVYKFKESTITDFALRSDVNESKTVSCKKLRQRFRKYF